MRRKHPLEFFSEFIPLGDWFVIRLVVMWPFHTVQGTPDSIAA
jgi:hypothetical protein